MSCKNLGVNLWNFDTSEHLDLEHQIAAWWAIPLFPDCFVLHFRYLISSFWTAMIAIRFNC